MSDTQEKFNIKTPFIIFSNIFLYAFRGLKYVCFDLWVNLYNGVGFRVNKTYQTAKTKLSDEDKIYNLSKKKPKKERTYNCSKRKLAKLEEEKKALLLDLQTAGASRSKEPHVYYYKVRQANGKIVYGTMNGFSKLDINAYLLNEGYDVYQIKSSSFIDFTFKDSSVLGKRLSTKDLIFWLTQLSTYIKAGITLNEAIKILTEQMKGSKAQTTAFKSISYELTLGESFSKALEKQGNMFPALLINMIKAAEASGTLSETLEDMSAYYTDVNETHKQMISAITYPAIISVFAFAVVVFILVYVVPEFTKIYAENGTEITGITKFIVDVSDFLKASYINIIGIIFGVVLVFTICYKKIKGFRAGVQMFLMKVPVIKNIIIYNELTIFSKTFASLLRNNVFITESMDILSRITTNEIYKAILYRTINNIVKGEKISEAFKDHWAVPDVAYYMIVTGENTGDLANMMQKVSEYYQMMHKNIVNNLKSLLEPILIVFLAVVVGGILVAVVVPMFQMYDQITV